MRRAATKHAIMVRGSHENAAGPRTPILLEGKGRVRARRRPARRPRTHHHPSLSACLACLPARTRSCVVVHFQVAASSRWSRPLLAGHRPESPNQPSPHVNKPPASQRSDASLAYPDNIDYFINRISAKWALITFNWPAANCSSNVFSSLISSSSFLQLHIVACIITPPPTPSPPPLTAGRYHSNSFG